LKEPSAIHRNYFERSVCNSSSAREQIALGPDDQLAAVEHDLKRFSQVIRLQPLRQL
jgi:hypothetical protein